MTAKDNETASFGYEEVPAEEKAGLVQGVFTRVASRYDLMNDLMSAGVHRIWKAGMVDWLAPRPGMRVLDVAGGTGDIARRINARVKGEIDITLCDITHSMLVAGRARGGEGFQWVCGDAERLPFPRDSFDAYTIAFGIRNVTHIDRVLQEARRVLRPGGRFLCLEFSRVVIPGFEQVYDAYSFNVIPRIGGLVARDRDSYQYLVESIRRFPDQPTFAAMIEDAGLRQVRVRNLSGGIAALHSAWRI